MKTKINEHTREAINNIPDLFEEKREKESKEAQSLETEFKLKLCVALYDYRRSQKMSNKEFSEKLGMDPSVISKIENFKVGEVSLSTLLGTLSLVKEKMGGLESLIERVKHVA